MSDLAKRSGDLFSLLEKMRPAITQALPKHISPERIARIALTALRSNPRLAECTQASFLGSLLQASQLGLEVNTPLGFAYLIPCKNKGVQTCTLIIGYQGMLDLARRSGMVRAIYAYAVYEGDTFSYELGLEPKLVHKPDDATRGALTHVYAVARLTDGEPIFTVLTRAQVESFRKRSRAATEGPWVTDYDAMALKTAIRRIFKWLPKSAEMATALVVDEADDTERERGQSDAFAPEIASILAEVPDEAAPSPVPAGTAEGQRVKLPGKGKAAPPAADQAKPEDSWGKAPEPPAPPITATAPPVDLVELHETLAEVDDAWSKPGSSSVLQGWTEAQRKEALHWANAVLMNGPMAIQANRPAHTLIGRQPGEEG